MYTVKPHCVKVNRNHGFTLSLSSTVKPVLRGDLWDKDFIFFCWCFNGAFNNISAISWQPVLVVEEAGVPRENHRP